MWGEVDATRAEAFRLAAEEIYLAPRPADGGIGTLGERRLHAVIKHFLSPDPATQERRVGRYCADILSDTCITEVQTRRMDRLVDKLRAFLPTYEVTIVYPIARYKQLSWVDPASGEISPARRSPIHGCVQDALYELFYLREFLLHPRFHVHVMLFDMQEYRLLTGYGKQRKIRAPRAERLPRALVAEYTLDTPSDYARLIPDALPDSFTAAEYAAAVGISPAARSRAMKVLTDVGALQMCGRRGRAFLYTRGTGGGTI